MTSNRLFRPTIAALIVMSCLLLSHTAWSQQAEDLGDYLVHYNAINTNLLPPDVARAYGIQRSGNRALLNIAVLRKVPDDMDEPVTARVTATAVNLAGQRREIDLSEIQEQDAIYYIGSFRIHDEETLTFRISVTPGDSNRPPREFSFRQKFYTG